LKYLICGILCLFAFILFPLSLHPKTFIQDPLQKDEVKRTFERFLTKERAFIQRGLNNASFYLPIIERIFAQKKLPRDLIYLPLIESAFSVRAYSKAGASGLWQFMPGTARFYHLKIDFWVDERRDPFKSTEKAAKHLRDLHNYYKNWELTLAAYNAGMGAVNFAIKNGNTSDYWKLCAMKFLKRETREYVPRFLAAAHIAKDPAKYGFSVNNSAHFPEFEILITEKPVDLTILGKRTEIKLKELRFLNPELKLLLTPFGSKYSLRIPKNKYTEAVVVYNEFPKDELTGLRWYTVSTGETLGEIAQKYRTRVSLLKQINNIKNYKRVYAGKKILIPVYSKNAEIEDVVIYIPKKGFYTQEIQYLVQKGDTVWDIAQRFRTDIETIFAVNGLSFESIIMPGDEIILWINIALQR